jgi:hypothetical protein
MKSVGLSGIGNGYQRSWLGGVGGTVAKSDTMEVDSTSLNGRCTAAGRIRYSQERRLWLRGAVNAVPEICSAYRPYGARCGEFWPAGSAPSSASVAN